MERKCTVCEKEITHKRRDAIFCSNECGNKSRNRKWRKLNPDKIRVRNRKINSNIKSRVFTRIKSRAKLNDIPFDLEIEDIVIPEICPVLGIPIIQNRGKKGYFPDSISVDRVVPERGYVKGNIQVISWRANLLKSDATIEDLEKVIDYLKNVRGY